jgi:hypothetical protein
MKKDKFILAIVTFGFLFLTIETRHSHAGAWTSVPTAYIAPIACALAFLIGLGGLVAQGKFANILGVLMILISGVGAAGVYFHTRGDFSQLERLLSSNYRQEKVLRSQDHLGGIFDERPLIAPLSISGLSLVAAICLINKADGRKKSK